MYSFRLTLSVMAVLAAPRFAAAQRVVADISIRKGPIAGHFVLGDRFLTTAATTHDSPSAATAPKPIMTTTTTGTVSS